MKNKKSNQPKLVVHVDIDSPIKLMNFYQIKGIKFETKDLEMFYETSLNRALQFFEKHNVKATFFVVGDELESSKVIQKVILKVHEAGHEIENHTYSHPFGLATLSDDNIIYEIKKCSEIIELVTGRTPIGFRSPGYSINSKIINLLQDNGFKYDSSGFWSIMNPILKSSHKLLFKNGLKNEGFGYVTRKLGQKPYTPDTDNWLLRSNNNRKFWELPLPRTGILGLPFYNNFNLWTPSAYANLISKFISKPYIVYLFHIIEFMDLNDSIPHELNVHPNLTIPLNKKIKRAEKIMTNLYTRYKLINTEKLVQELADETNVLV